MTVEKLTSVQTAEQTFDMIANHLIAQRVPAKDKNKCVYRAPNGTMCAIGCIIPDSLYSPKVEDTTFSMLAQNKKIGTYLKKIHPSLFDSVHTWTNFGNTIQEFHDEMLETFKTKRDLVRALRRLARANGIKTTIPIQ